MESAGVSAAPLLPENSDDSAYIFMIPTSCQNSDEVPRPHETITPPPREAQARNITICLANENQEFLLGIVPDRVLSWDSHRPSSEARKIPGCGAVFQ